MNPSALPIDPLLPDIVAALASAQRLVLRAPPGAGKTTRVPAALLDAGVAGGKQVVVLEPRRIAARAAAEFVARERGSRVGAEVGYRVRFEQRGDARTRLWFVTEGVLSRQLSRDPFLEAAGVIVLDEFHERHLQGDVALAVIRELQATVRPDLKLVVMSATLDTERVAAYLGDCPVRTSTGRAHPIRIDHAAPGDDRPLAGRVVSAVRRLLTDQDDGGDILVFLPGAAEIARAAAALAAMAGERALDIVPLHGNLPLEAQQRAIMRGARRKLVLATNVAETALTVEGVTAVIDSGLARLARFDARHGINALRLAPISRDAAEQRAGRAGRTAPGRCIRLWPAAEHQGRREHEVPEILRLDLSTTVLELRAWGLRDLEAFGWLDPPPAAALRHAERLLAALGALDGATGAVTTVGHRLLQLAAPARLARLLLEAAARGCAAAGAVLAALASERDICLERRTFGSASGRESHAYGSDAGVWPSGPSDLLLRYELFLAAARAAFAAARCRALGLDAGAVRAVDRTRRQLGRVVGAGSALADGPVDVDALLRCTLAGFPDRVVRRRAPGSRRGVMVGGAGVELAAGSVVREAELFVAVDVDAGPRSERAEARAYLASAIERPWLTELFPNAVHRVSELLFDSDGGRVIARTQERYLDLVLEERRSAAVDPLAAGTVLADYVRRTPNAIALHPAEEGLMDRLRFLSHWMPVLGWPADLARWTAEAIASLCAGCRSLAQVRAADLGAALLCGLTGPQRQALDRDAPAELTLPSGRRVVIRYERDKPPAVSARIAELFGLTATPRLAGGRVALVMEILAPNHRPVQITDDLESFWRRTYPEVRKQLRARYPKHPWPEDPLRAVPTSRTRRRGSES